MKKKKSHVRRLLPSLREKKRYLAFSVLSNQKITDRNAVRTAIASSLSSYIGTLGMAEAGFQFLDYSDGNGIIRVNHHYLDHLRASFCLLSTISNQSVIVHSTKASGMIANVKNS